MILVALAIFGLCLGSFANAVVWRIHEQEALAHQAKKQAKAQLKPQDKAQPAKKVSAQDLSIMKGRSMCPHCHHTLAFTDLVPVFSWLVLRGRCRYCQQPISWQYPLVELATGVLFVLSGLQWLQAAHPYSAQAITHLIVWLVLLVGLMALVVYDLRWMLLPNRIVYPLIVLAAANVLADSIIFGEGLVPLKGAALGLLAAAVPFFLIFQLSRGKWIGGGDVKLGVLIGLVVLGFLPGLLTIFLASVLGSLLIIPLMITRRLHANSRIPFGPFLIAALTLVYLYGDSWIAWYKIHVLLLV